MKLFYVFIILSALTYTEAANNLWTAKEYQITIIELSHESEKEGEKTQDDAKIYSFILNDGIKAQLENKLLSNKRVKNSILTPHMEIHSPPPEL